MIIDWESKESYLLINPVYSFDAYSKYLRILEQASDWPGHFWLATSGSTVLKWVGLSKQAILASAQAVNDHLQSNDSDRWALALPIFHVGGLGILARSYLSRASVDDFKTDRPGKWDAEAFYQYLQAKNSTLTALVPSQLHDMVQLNQTAPSSLRAVIIGGGPLLPELYSQALHLGWKVLTSYGLTECASQVATASLSALGTNDGQELEILSHIKAGIINDRLAFKGPSLLSVYAFCEADKMVFHDPKQEGWFVTEDRGKINAGKIAILGRVDQIIKIGGENVDLAALESLLQSLKLRNQLQGEITLLAVPHERLGHTIHLAATEMNQDNINQVRDAFNQQVLPFERIREVHTVSEIPKSSLSKILRKDLLEKIKRL